MNSQPLVSIGLPVYNGELFLKEAIDSLLKQSFTNFEIVISDNASTDRTEQICKDYSKQDKRIRYYRSPQNKGAAWNFNRTFELATGQYFKWAAHDDFCAPTYLESCIKVLDSDPSIVLCHAETVLIDEESQKLQFKPSLDCFVNKAGKTFRKQDHSKYLDADEPHKRYTDLLFSVRWCFEVFGLIRTSTLKQTSLIGPYYGSDKVLLAELSLLGRFAKVPEELFFRRCQMRQSSMIDLALDRELWIASALVNRSFASPRLSCFHGYLQAIFDAKLTVLESAFCLASLAAWSVNMSNWRRFGLEVKREIGRTLSTQRLNILSVRQSQKAPD